MHITTIGSGSEGNCYLISDGHSKLLLECGVRWQTIQRAADFQTSDIEGCLITHSHKDHCAAADEVLKRGIPIYTSQGTKGDMKAGSHQIRTLNAREQVEVGTFLVTAFDVDHDTSEPFGFILQSLITGEKLLFATDAYFIRYKFNGLTHIMLETNYSHEILNANAAEDDGIRARRGRILRSHMSLENAIAFLQKMDLSSVQQIYLLHLSNDNAHAPTFKQRVMAATGKPVYVEY